LILCSFFYLSYLLQRFCHHRHLHSFPTRRSSDLNYNFLGVKNLDVQTEYSQVRPFTYAHYSPITNFGHMNQELAHPLGANFRESISFLTYRHRRWHLHLEAMYAIHGKDYYDASRPADEQISWGGDIFVSVNNRFDSHGHVIGQGMETTIQHAAAS